MNLNNLMSLCKRRGFVFQNSEIYGGLGSTWDYGPLGVELKRNVKNSWWKTMVHDQDNIVGIDGSILMHSDVWRASGHVDNFSDPLVECKNCNQRWRDDQITDQECPACNGELTNSRMFNLMFKTYLGPVEKEENITFLRPETAQGIFVNFNNVLKTTRRKLPFGIAQIGKAFRNEITTGNFIFRTREFEMMEIEYFVKPESADESYQFWINRSHQWYKDLGVSKERLRIRSHDKSELAHYSNGTSDIEYHFPWGWGEIQGTANRTDYDLKAHSAKSGEALTYFDEKLGEHLTPYVIEPSFGVDRAVMAFLLDAYSEEEVSSPNGKLDKRGLLKLNPLLAPVKVAVLPLSRNEKLLPIARELHDSLRRSNSIEGIVEYDDAQSIGKRYRRQDEIGTPLCVTIDFDSIEDNGVTIRERDSMDQQRVSIDKLIEQVTIMLRK